MGFVLFAAGIALVVAPDYSQRAQGLADALARSTGLQSGVLVLGGLVFFALGAFSRGIARSSGSARIPSGRSKGEDSPDASRAVERLAGDMAQLRNAVQRVASDVERSSETLQHVLQAQQAQLQAQPADPGQDQPLDGDPLFKLAGSLDHMNARLDERLNALAAQLDELLAGVPDEPGEPRGPVGTFGTGGQDPAGPSPAPGASGVEPLELMLSGENDPEATQPSEFFDGVEDLAEPEQQAPARKSASSKARTTKKKGTRKK